MIGFCGTTVKGECKGRTEEYQVTGPEDEHEENEEENDTLYPWEKLNGEELSAVQDENDDEYEDSNEFDEDMEEDYEEPDLYEEENTEEIIEEEEPATPVTLEEALQRQQAKELRKALSFSHG